MKKKKIVISLSIIILVIIGIIILIFNISNIKKCLKIGRTDDWVYSIESEKNSYINFSSGVNGLKNSPMCMDSASEGANIGYSVGGAKDINNFRENINSNYFPISTDITYTGLFYDYNFNTGKKNQSNDLFSPSYSYAISKDPISGELEYYMTVGLNSNIKQSDFKRKKLNLVIMLDISGSMSSSLDRYYYDDITNKEKSNKSKIQAATESINCLIDQLNDDDKFGVVLFDDGAYLGKEMNLVKNTDMEAIKNHILEIEAQGGTNFSDGYDKSTELFTKYSDIDSDEYENRIIVLTDAMPNLGETSKDSLAAKVKNNSDKKINTTFIGIGIDFNTNLIDSISKVKGCNYYSVHNVDEFKTRMGEQFDYMVTPLVFDLKLDFNSDYFEIQQIYGSDTADKDTGNIVNINTLFPSVTNSDGEVKGGVVLLKLKPKDGKDLSNKITKLKVSYKDRNGNDYSNEQNVEINNDLKEEYYENTGIRKAILLVRYVNTMKNWILYERTGEERFITATVYRIEDCGYCTPEEVKILLGEYERTSVKLSVSKDYKKTFEKIRQYIIAENNEIKDDTLDQEIKILEKLINY